MATDPQPSKRKRLVAASAVADGADGELADGSAGAMGEAAAEAEGGARAAKRLRLKVAPRGARIAQKRKRAGAQSGGGGGGRRDAILQLLALDEGSQQMCARRVVRRPRAGCGAPPLPPFCTLASRAAPSLALFAHPARVTAAPPAFSPPRARRLELLGESDETQGGGSRMHGGGGGGGSFGNGAGTCLEPSSSGSALGSRLGAGGLSRQPSLAGPTPLSRQNTLTGFGGGFGATGGGGGGTGGSGGLFGAIGRAKAAGGSSAVAPELSRQNSLVGAGGALGARAAGAGGGLGLGVAGGGASSFHAKLKEAERSGRLGGCAPRRAACSRRRRSARYCSVCWLLSVACSLLPSPSCCRHSAL